MLPVAEPIVLAGSPLFYALLIAIGLATGTYGTMVGLGGGIILLPVLLWLFPDTSPDILTGISLSVVFLNATSGTIAYARQSRIDYRSGLLFATATAPGVIIGVWLVRMVETRTFGIIFGILLLIVAALTIFRPQTNTPVAPETCTTAEGRDLDHQVRRAWGIALSFAAGFIAGLLGIGGGIINVPMMIYVLRFPLRIATATSQFILIFTTLIGILTHLILGMEFGNLSVVVFLALGAILGAQLGAQLSRWLRSILILRLLALALIVIGIRLIF